MIESHKFAIFRRHVAAGIELKTSGIMIFRARAVARIKLTISGLACFFLNHYTSKSIVIN
jgi:hypothetical protein